MKKSEFKIGKTFWMSGKKYLCTDIGTRTVIATRYNPGDMVQMVQSSRIKGWDCWKNILVKVEKRWFKPSYFRVGEEVIPDYDYDACDERYTRFQREMRAGWVKRERVSNKRWVAKPVRRERI